MRLGRWWLEKREIWKVGNECGGHSIAGVSAAQPHPNASTTTMAALPSITVDVNYEEEKSAYPPYNIYAAAE